MGWGNEREKRDFYAKKFDSFDDMVSRDFFFSYSLAEKKSRLIGLKLIDGFFGRGTLLALRKYEPVFFRIDSTTV